MKIRNYVDGYDLINRCLARRFDKDMNSNYELKGFGFKDDMVIIDMSFGEDELISFKLKEIKGEKRHYFQIVSEVCW